MIARQCLDASEVQGCLHVISQPRLRTSTSSFAVAEILHNPSTLNINTMASNMEGQKGDDDRGGEDDTNARNSRRTPEIDPPATVEHKVDGVDMNTEPAVKLEEEDSWKDHPMSQGNGRASINLSSASSHHRIKLEDSPQVKEEARDKDVSNPIKYP